MRDSATGSSFEQQEHKREWDTPSANIRLHFTGSGKTIIWRHTHEPTLETLLEVETQLSNTCMSLLPYTLFEVETQLFGKRMSLPFHSTIYNI